VSYLVQRLQQHHLATRSVGVHQPADPSHLPIEELLRLLDLLLMEIWEKRQAQAGKDIHQVLASLPIPIYITAEPSNLLVTALRRAGREPQVMLCPWNDYSRKTLKANKMVEPNPDQPLVYYLYGRLEEPESLALTEDALFDYLIGVTANKNLIPKRVRAALANSSLLFLGFRMDDWNFRVFFRTLMNQQGSEMRRNYAHIAVQIAPEEGRILQPRLAQQYFEEYFAKGADISVYWGSVEEFAQKLLRYYWEGGAR
jgi:hypothetical protein